MKFLFLIMMLFFALSKAASESTDYSKLLEDAIRSYRDSSTIFYIDSSFSFYGKFSRFAKMRSVEGFADLRTGNKVVMLFSRKELRYVDEQFSMQHRILWTDNYLRNSVRLSEDSIRGFLNRDLPEFQNQNKYRYYYYFSQPVILRDDSVAIFRLAEMINTSAGYDFVFIYVKDNDRWRRKMTIVAGAW